MSCKEVSKTDWGAEQVFLHPVYTGKPEDNTFAEATPGGRLELTISNPAAHGFFVPLKDYYIDITVAT